MTSGRPGRLRPFAALLPFLGLLAACGEAETPTPPPGAVEAVVLEAERNEIAAKEEAIRQAHEREAVAKAQSNARLAASAKARATVEGRGRADANADIDAFEKQQEEADARPE